MQPMKNIKIYKLLLMALCALTIGSCDTTEDPDSVITSFPSYPVTTSSTAVVAEETEEGLYTFDFALDGKKQINPITLEVGVGSNSTAVEGEDFELSTHTIDLAAFEGQDGFSIDIQVLEDFEPESEDETIYLTFTTTAPSGVDNSQTLLVTIKDSGLTPPVTMDLTLRWAFDDELLAPSTCDVGMDIDMTFQTQGSAPYDDDLLDFATSTGACPETGTLILANMEDGVVYDIWIMIYAGFDFGDASAMTVSIDYEKSDGLVGSIDIEGVFDSTMEEEAGIVGTIQRDGDVITIKDTNGDVVAEGRAARGVQLVHGVKKPI
jgi:hypothetical protein